MNGAARPRRTRILLGSVIAMLLWAGSVPWPSSATATVTFGRSDVRTVFHIAKSDDDNRVDYGIRLDARCEPLGRAPVYAYWHRFEPGEPRFGDLNLLDEGIYGITNQAVRSRSASGSWIDMRVGALPDQRILILVQRHGDGCVARAQMRINDRLAFVDRVFVQLGGGLFGGVQHVTFTGIDQQTQERISERRRPRR